VVTHQLEVERRTGKVRPSETDVLPLALKVSVDTMFGYVACMQVGYNWFERNAEHAVRIVPLLSAVGRIANNTFVNHSRYVLLLDNGDDLLDERYYQSALVHYEVRTPHAPRKQFDIGPADHFPSHSLHTPIPSPSFRSPSFHLFFSFPPLPFSTTTLPCKLPQRGLGRSQWKSNLVHFSLKI